MVWKLLSETFSIKFLAKDSHWLSVVGMETLSETFSIKFLGKVSHVVSFVVQLSELE